MFTMTNFQITARQQKTIHRCSETRPSHSDMGSHTHCRISGQRQTGSISLVSARSCAGPAIATAVRI